MFGRPICYWITLIAGCAWPAAAQQPRAQRPIPDVENQVVPFFDSFLAETETERQAIESVSIDAKQERQIGDADLAAYLSSLKERQIRVSEKGRDVEYVSSLIESIHSKMKNAKKYGKIRVLVAHSEETDARAFPGGSIVVMTGMVDIAASEAALVGVLGHELSHIDHGHQLRRARAITLAQDGWQSENFNGKNLQNNLMLMAKNVARPFHASDEAAADQDGAAWAFELGYQPMELARLFERFARRQQRETVMSRGTVPSFLLSHPAYENRWASIRERSVQLQREQPGAKLYVGRMNLQQRVARSEREFPE